MRRLPLYVCIDCGINMHSLFPKVKDAVAELLVAARNDPWALESMWMSFVSVGSKLNVVKPLCPLEEVRGVNVQPIANRAEVCGFEVEMAKIFSKDLILQNTATQKRDRYPGILWLSDGSRPDFVKKCSDEYHWKRYGSFVLFQEVNVSTENIGSKPSVISLLTSGIWEEDLFWRSDRV